MKPCPKCRGTGEVAVIRGAFCPEVDCPVCKGTGQVEDNLESDVIHNEEKQIDSYTIRPEHYSLADKLLKRLEDLQFKDSQRNDIAEFFAILSAG